jgi:F-box protein 18 (helicase)
MIFTDEQQKIIRTTPEPGRPLVVTAFAGTGKTFTLERYAEARPASRMLYAAFNKAIQLEAKKKMPRNVMSRTTHSLAYRAFGSKYRDAELLEPNIPVWKVARYLGTDDIITANFVINIIGQYMASADKVIENKHIPENVIAFYAKDQRNIPPLVEMSSGVWGSMISLKPSSIPLTHDGYLKLYQLSGPKLHFDYIMLDEAQDTTPCVWDIMFNQQARKVVVGDPHQAIYSWRGAIDAIGLVEDAEHCYLTQSFRFGPDVGKLASTLLRRFKGEDKPVRGFDQLQTKISVDDPSERRTVLARGNALIFKASAYESEHTPKTLGYVGGDHRNYRFQIYQDVYNLHKRNHDWIKDPVVKSFEDYDEMKEYAEKVQSLELQGACLLVEEYKGRIPWIMKRVKERDIGARDADLVFATGHKAKGMEFPIVQIAGDFESVIDFHLEDGVVPDDELNLLYVAMTRGTKLLYIPPGLKRWVETGRNVARKKPEQEELFGEKPKQEADTKVDNPYRGMRIRKGEFLNRLAGMEPRSSVQPHGGGAMVGDDVPDRIKKFWG